MNNIEDIVNNGTCIGCMACIELCPFGPLATEEGDFGYPVPLKVEDCNDCGICLLECPGAGGAADE